MKGWASRSSGACVANPRMNAESSDPWPADKPERFAHHRLHEGAVPVPMQRHPVAQPRGHGPLVVVEEIGTLRAEPEQVAVCVEDLIRLLPEGAAERFLREEEVGEMGRHKDKIA